MEKKFKDSVQNLDKAMAFLEEAISTPVKEKRDLGGIILGFVNVFELMWKTMKRYLEEEGFQIRTPREALEQSFKAGLVFHSEVWVEMIEDRNSSVDTYDEAFAKQFYDRIMQRYIPRLRETHQIIKTKAN